MIVAGIRETKTHLSSYLAAVRAGEEVLITDRGRPVARIIREPARTASLSDQLPGLAATGIVTLPTQPGSARAACSATGRRQAAVRDRPRRSPMIASCRQIDA